MANTYIRLNLGGAGGTDDKRVKVSGDDSNSGFLEEKVVAGSSKVVIDTLNPGLIEELSLDIDDTQIDHDQLLNFEESEHKPLNDAVTSADSLWSSQKVQDELDTKVDKVSSTDNALSKFDGIEGQLQDTGIIVDDSNNVTGVNDLTIDGNLTVNGTTTTVNTETVDIEDANITLNKNGTQATADAQDAGITVEMSDATDAKVGYDSSTSSKFVAGELGSESEILTKDHVQDVLNKTIDATAATGTNTITMDSDDVLYDSTISGLFSNNVKDSLDELNERDLFNQYHLYEDNALAYADAEQGVIDPTTQERDGWYYTNVNTGEKINWYYFDGTTQGTVTLGEFSAYAIMTFDSISSTPIFAIYTFPTGTGDVFPGFAHSRAVYSEPMSITPVVGQKYVVYFGQNPNVHPELPRIELSYSASNSLGDLNPLEPVLTVSFGSNSSEPVGDVKYMVQELGIYSDPVKHNVELRIKHATNKELQDHLSSTTAHDADSIVYDNTTSGLVATNAQSAIDEVKSSVESSITDIYQVTNEPTGFQTRDESTITFDDVTYTLTIAPVTSSFTFYVKGNKFTKTSAESLQIDNTQSGNHYFYYDENGVLNSTQVPSQELFTENALVSIVYWNADINSHVYFAEERHGLQMDGATHGYLHTTFGARYLSGHALQSFTIGNGSLDSHAQFNADGGSIRDEDLLLQSVAQSQIPILYRQGSLWRKKTADSFPLIYTGTAGYSGTNVPYNEYDGANWVLTEALNNEFVLVHFFATNDIDNPIVGIQGINSYNNAPDARDAASTEISSLSGIPFVEFVAIGTVIFQTSSSYANSVRAKVEPIGTANYIDFRGTQLYTPAGEATTHSLLSGLLNDDHLQYHTDARADEWLQNKYPNDVYENHVTLLDNQPLQTATGIFVNGAEVNAVFCKFVIVRDGVSEVVEITGSSVPSSSAWDYIVEHVGSDTGIEISFLNDQVYYTSTSTGSNATLTYRISVLGAN